MTILLSSRAERFPVLGRGDSGRALEGAGEMTLVAEARRQGNLHNRRLGGGQCAARILNPQLAHIISHSTAVGLVEHLGQMDRVYPDSVGDLSQRQALG